MLCNTGEVGRPFRGESYAQTADAVQADGVHAFRVAEQSEWPIRTSEGFERGGAVEAKAARSVLVGESNLQLGRAACRGGGDGPSHSQNGRAPSRPRVGTGPERSRALLWSGRCYRSSGTGASVAGARRSPFCSAKSVAPTRVDTPIFVYTC
jgi:hypothetical protein